MLRKDIPTIPVMNSVLIIKGAVTVTIFRKEVEIVECVPLLYPGEHR